MNRFLFIKHQFHKRMNESIQENEKNQNENYELTPSIIQDHLKEPTQELIQEPTQELIQKPIQKVVINLIQVKESDIKINDKLIKEFKNSKKEFKKLLKENIEIENYLKDLEKSNEIKNKQNNQITKDNIFI